MTDDSTELIERLRNGDQDAARQLYQQYVQRLLNLARSHLSRQFNSRLDPEDVVQSVYRTIFRRVQDGRFEFEADDDLCGLLVRTTLNKVWNKVRHHRAGKRTVQREQATGNTDLPGGGMVDQLSRGPSTTEAIIFADLMETVLSRLGEREQLVLQLKLEGHSQQEIADQLGVTDRTVRRISDGIRDRMSSLLADDEEE